MKRYQFLAVFLVMTAIFVMAFGYFIEGKGAVIPIALGGVLFLLGSWCAFWSDRGVEEWKV